MASHVLKIDPVYFDAVVSGRKTFEIRFNDRNFLEGDLVRLREYGPASKDTRGIALMEYSGREAVYRIGYVTNHRQIAGYVVMSLLPYTE